MKKRAYIRPAITIINVEPHGLLRNVGSGTVDPIDILGKGTDFEEEDDDTGGVWNNQFNSWSQEGED